jgi:microcystin-dependent protein
MPGLISIDFATTTFEVDNNPSPYKSVSAKLLSDVLGGGSVSGGYVKKAGDTMSGALTLNGAPTSDFQAATKKYVDDNVGVTQIMAGTGITLNPGTGIGAVTVGVNSELLMPVGAVVAFGMNSAPAGWLICNGDTVPNGVGTIQGRTANFSALHTLLGSSHGAAGRLPDLRGLFVRGQGSSVIGSNTYTGTFALRQGDATKLPTTALTGVADSAGSHSHTYTYRGGTAQSGNSIAGVWIGTGNANTSSAGAHTHTVTINAGGDAETRPANIALLYCIKY